MRAGTEAVVPGSRELDLLRQSGLAGELEGGTNPTRHCRDRVQLIDAALSQESVVVQALMSLLAILMLGAWITDPQLMKARSIR